MSNKRAAAGGVDVQDVKPDYAKCAGKMIVTFRLLEGQLVPECEFPVVGMITEMALEKHANYFHRQLRIARARERGNIAQETVIGEEKYNEFALSE